MGVMDTWEKINKNTKNVISPKVTTQPVTKSISVMDTWAKQNNISVPTTKKTTVKPILSSVLTAKKGKSIVQQGKKVSTTTYMPKATPLKDLTKVYENLGTGIIQGVQGVGKYLTGAQSVTGKAIKIGTNIIGAVNRVLGKKENKVLNTYGNIQGKLGEVSEKASNKIGIAMQNKQTQAQYQTSTINNPLLKKASEYSTVIGQQIPTIGASIINPVLGTAVATTSAGGQYMQEAEQKGANKYKALASGTAKGLLEGATEMIGVGALLKGTKSLAKGGIKTAAKEFGINIVNNALQEAAMEPASEIVDQKVLGKSDWNNIAKRMVKSGIDGALVATIMSGAGAGLGKAVNITNKIAEGKQNSITQSEINQAVAEANTKLKTYNETPSQKINVTQEQVQKGLTTSKLNPLEQTTVQAPTTQNKAVLNQQEGNTPIDNTNNIKPIINNKYYRFELDANKNNNVKFYSKQKDYVDEYKYVQEKEKGRTGNLIEENIKLNNPLIVEAKGGQFSDNNFEAQYIRKAISNGNDGVVFRNEDGDEFVAKIQSPKTQNKTVLSSQTSNILPTTLKDNTKNIVTGTGQSNLINSIQGSKFLNEEAKQVLSKQSDIKYYDKINNETTLQQANDKITQGGQQEVNRWMNIDPKTAKAQDVAEGMILLENYQKNADYNSMVEVAKKLRKMGTEAGQTVQAFSIMQRLTPEGMVQYAQSQLTDVYDELLKTKTKDWIAKNVGDLTLTENEVQSIVQKMQEVQNMPDGRAKIVKLAEINKIVTDKIPPSAGEGIKAYRRIAMLLNPKTINRNILGNALISPLNAVGDTTAGTLVDKAISKFTGVRTTGVTNVKSYTKGMLQGTAEAFDDFIKGINTRDISSDKFELGRGKNFKDKGLGKALNKLDALTSFSLDVGDRPFFKAEFMNSLYNQMKLNKVTEPTADMIEVATKVAEQRTWQDTNAYSKAVVGLRNSLNKLNVKGVGLGDIVVPFAKTPANLTKALVDYSPAGVINAIVDSKKLRVALKNDTFTPQLQKQVVDDISKAFVGTMLYVIGGALAKAGVTSGEADEDKDVAKFKKDVMGIQPYSIKIGDKTFTYDWAQPIAAPLGIMANVEQNKEKDTKLYQDVLNAISQGGNMLYEQSFLQNVKKIFTSYEGPMQGIIDTISTVPSSFIPTFIKQLNDIIDPIQRNTYEYKDVVKTSINQIKSKIPFLSKTLSTQKDVLGRDVKKYSGENNILNVFLNPANIGKENLTDGAKEVLRVYEATGDKTIIPRVASNYIDFNNKKFILGSKEKTDYQEGIGTKTSSELDKLATDKNYTNLDDTSKAKVINSILTDVQALQKQEYLAKKGEVYEIPNTLVEAQNEIAKGLPSSSYYVYKNTIDILKGDKEINKKGKEVTIDGSTMSKKATAINNLKISDENKNSLLLLAQPNSETPVTYNDIKDLSSNSYQAYFSLTDKQRTDYKALKELNVTEEALNKYYADIGNIEGVKDENGKTKSGSKKANVFSYINSLPISKSQKIALFVNAGYDTSKYKSYMFDYVNSLQTTKERKQEIWKSLGY